MSKEKLIIIFTVLIDVIGIGIIIPVMPAYVESFNVSAFVVTLLFSVFSLFSFLSSPLLGVLSDKYGRRPILMASILSTSIGWFVFAGAPSLLFIFLGRILDGLAAGNFSTAQSAIADLSTDAKDRTANLGMVGAIFGLGFLVGPLIGGLLSKVSTAFPFWFVGGLSLLNFILAYFFLPETNKNLDRTKQIHWNPVKPIIVALQDLKLRRLYIIWFLFNMIAIGANAVFALYLMEQFGFGAYETGLFFTGVGLIIAFNQGFALKHFWLKKFTEKQLIILMFLLFSVGFGLMAYPSLRVFISGVICMAFGQSVLRVAITSEIMGEADETERGQATGALTGVMSVASVIAPLYGGALLEVRHYAPFLLAAVLGLLALTVIVRRPFPHIPTPNPLQ
jgi:DHA1 family tetracycline resistance protein-like MFS transporter